MKCLFFAILFLPLINGQRIESSKAVLLQGKVVGAAGEALPRVIVRLSGGSEPANALTTSSDENGTFRFYDLQPGQYTLRATKAGFLDDVQASSTILNLKLGAELKDVILRLTPQVVVTGKVTDQYGDPVPGIQVLAMRDGYASGRHQLTTVGSTQTNDQGDYRINNLASGRYYFQASDPRLIDVTINGWPPGGPRRDAVVPTYSPSAETPSRVEAVEILPASELRGMDIRLLRAPVYSVRGRAITDDGTSMASRRLVLAPNGSDQASLTIVRNYSVAQIQQDGTFELHNLRPGTFEFAFAGISQGPTYTTHMEVVINARDIEGLEVPFITNGPIDGVVSIEGTPSAINLTGLTVRLAQIGGTPVSIGNGRVQNDGTFRILGGGALAYLWSVSGLPPEFYVKSVRFGPQDVTRAPIDNASGRGGHLEIVLSPNSANLSGVAKSSNGKEAPGSFVCLWPKVPDLGSLGAGVRSTTTNQNGEFHFPGLPPGDYYVGVWERLDLGLAESSFLSQFRDDVALVSLLENERKNITISLVSANRVAAEIAKIP